MCTYHKTTRCVECIISKTFSRVSDLAKEDKLTIPAELEFIERGVKDRATFNRQAMRPDDLLLLDDHSIYSLLLKWSKNNDDSVLNDLSTRIASTSMNFQSIRGSIRFLFRALYAA